MNTHEVRGMDVVKGIYNFENADDGGVNTMFRLMNGIQQGDGFYQRDGNKVAMKSIHLRGYIHPRTDLPSGSTNPYVSHAGKLRMIIVYDRQPTGAFPDLGDLLRTHNTDGNPGTSSEAGINLNSRARFAILRDTEWASPAFKFNVTEGTYTDGHPIGYTGESTGWVINEFIKLKDLGVVFKGTSTTMTIAHLASGAVYMVLLKSGQNVHMQATLGWRVRYSDQ